jgi:large subunit ribosomal protein L9
MEVILKEDIPNVGKIGEVVRVRDGYARNYLLPRGLVLVANKRNLKVFEHQKRVVAAQKERVLKHAQSLSEKLAGALLTIPVKAGEEGKLFGSVTNMDIEKALKAKGFEIERRKIHLDEPIKSLGDYEVPVRLTAEVTALVKVSVVAEEVKG